MAENKQDDKAAAPKGKKGGGKKGGGKGKGGDKPAAAGGDKAAPAEPAKPAPPVPRPRLWTQYRTEIKAALRERFGYKSDLAVPRLEKIIVSMGVGKALKEPKRLEEAEQHLTALTGQKAVRTKARQAVSNFRLRIGNEIGAKVTLRRARMYEFLDRLIAIAIPRIRDFRGLSDKAFDGRGNYNFGLSEQTVFTEIDADRMQFTQGMNITIVTTAKSDKEAFELLSSFGFPFRRSS